MMPPGKFPQSVAQPSSTRVGTGGKEQREEYQNTILDFFNPFPVLQYGADAVRNTLQKLGQDAGVKSTAPIRGYDPIASAAAMGLAALTIATPLGPRNARQLLREAGEGRPTNELQVLLQERRTARRNLRQLGIELTPDNVDYAVYQASGHADPMQGWSNLVADARRTLDNYNEFPSENLPEGEVERLAREFWYGQRDQYLENRRSYYQLVEGGGVIPSEKYQPIGGTDYRNRMDDLIDDDRDIPLEEGFRQWEIDNRREAARTARALADELDARRNPMLETVEEHTSRIAALKQKYAEQNQAMKDIVSGVEGETMSKRVTNLLDRAINHPLFKEGNLPPLELKLDDDLMMRVRQDRVGGMHISVRDPHRMAEVHWSQDVYPYPKSTYWNSIAHDFLWKSDVNAPENAGANIAKLFPEFFPARTMVDWKGESLSGDSYPVVMNWMSKIGTDPRFQAKGEAIVKGGLNTMGRESGLSKLSNELRNAMSPQWGPPDRPREEIVNDLNRLVEIFNKRFETTMGGKRAIDLPLSTDPKELMKLSDQWRFRLPYQAITKTTPFFGGGLLGYGMYNANDRP